MTEASQQVISGLEGVLAFESSIAFIDGAIPELSFRGYDIQDIAQNLTFEQAAYLLWNDRLPSDDELAAFSAELAGQRAVPEALIGILRGLPASAHPMAALRTVVSWLGAMDAQAEDIGAADNQRKAMGADGADAHHRGGAGTPATRPGAGRPARRPRPRRQLLLHAHSARPRTTPRPAPSTLCSSCTPNTKPTPRRSPAAWSWAPRPTCIPRWWRVLAPSRARCTAAPSTT